MRSGECRLRALRAANFTMDRREIRDLAAGELGIRTAPFRYASSLAEMERAAGEIGLPCVVKPLMSSSGKGSRRCERGRIRVRVQARGDEQRARSRRGSDRRGLRALSHGDHFLLTVTQKAPPFSARRIGHVRERGDYQESWQPHPVPAEALTEAQGMAERITRSLRRRRHPGAWSFPRGGRGGVLRTLPASPRHRPRDPRGHATHLSEFELHARAVLGLRFRRSSPYGRSECGHPPCDFDSGGRPQYQGLGEALSEPGIDVRIFGSKPMARVNRRMGVALAAGPLDGAPAAGAGKAAARCVRFTRGASDSA